MLNQQPISPATDLYAEFIHHCAVNLFVTLVENKQSTCEIPFTQFEELLNLPQAQESEKRDIPLYAEWLSQVSARDISGSVTTFQPFFINSEIDRTKKVLRLHLNPIIEEMLKETMPQIKKNHFRNTHLQTIMNCRIGSYARNKSTKARAL